MNPGSDNQVDRTAATHSEGVVPSLSRPANPGANAQTKPLLQTKHSVMDTLLGQNNLAAFDAGGNDPYNATGRQFRR
jgi:hypothetical protein